MMARGGGKSEKRRGERSSIRGILHALSNQKNACEHREPSAPEGKLKEEKAKSRPAVTFPNENIIVEKEKNELGRKAALIARTRTDVGPSRPPHRERKSFRGGERPGLQGRDSIPTYPRDWRAYRYDESSSTHFPKGGRGINVRNCTSLTRRFLPRLEREEEMSPRTPPP